MNELWVAVCYHSHEPSEVYGPFGSQAEGIEWCERQTKGIAAWEVKLVLNVQEEQ